MEPIKILVTDRLFSDSPDIGDPTCLCSRCGLAIAEEIGIRAWPSDGGEYRYHHSCLIRSDNNEMRNNRLWETHV